MGVSTVTVTCNDVYNFFLLQVHSANYLLLFSGSSALGSTEEMVFLLVTKAPYSTGQKLSTILLVLVFTIFFAWPKMINAI